MMDCLFCKIINSKISTTYKDKEVIAFNDIHPCAPTHQLIVPIKHIATLNDVTDDDTALLGHMLQIARRLAEKAGIAESGYRTVFNCNKDGGQEIYHLHLHLIGGRPLHWPPG